MNTRRLIRKYEICISNLEWHLRINELDSGEDFEEATKLISSFKIYVNVLRRRINKKLKYPL